MSLEAGTSLGHYEVLSPLGAGGMGEVYRARDTKLDRDVAIKLLLEELSSDPERLARFEREAKVLASLNHPNIATLHGFEREGETSFLIMELIEGDTLADRISRGPIPVEDAIPIFLQIAEGLEAAHDRGVIHRDLKPANIKLGADGSAVKILDFGLAKALSPEAETAGSAAASMSPTLTLAATQRGEILGTAAYMAPEQARGLPVDKRADVWAFGVCLYEALSGRRVFEGEDASLILASVLKDEPSLEDLPESLPLPLQRLLRRCLRKNARDRLHDIADARLELQEALNDPDEPRHPTEAEVAPAPRRSLPAYAAAAIAGALLAGLAVWAVLGTRSPPQPTPKRFTVTLPESDRLGQGRGGVLALSPDGTTLVYGATRDGVPQLFRRPIDRFEATPISGAEGGHEPFFSPDGQWLGFRESELLLKVSLVGGPAQTLTTLPGGIRGADWESYERIVVGGWGALLEVPAVGGEATTLFSSDDGRQAWYPQVLSGGEAILFTLSESGPDGGEVRLLFPATGEQRTLLANAAAGGVLDTGHLVFLRSGALWAVEFDSDRLEIVGDPVPVVEGIRVEGGGAVQYALAENGTLAYVPGTAVATERLLVWVDHDGGEEPTPAPPRDYSALSVSPNGRQAAVSINDSGSAEIWVLDLGRGTLARLTTDERFDGLPLWSPDGSRIVYLSHRNDQPQILWQRADGSGAAELLLTFDGSATSASPNGWSPDGTVLFVSADFPETSGDIGMMSMDQPGTWEPLIQTAADERGPALSPDGRWLAYASDESGLFEIYIQRFPELEGRVAVSVGGAHTPIWSPDGRELFYLRGSGRPEAVMSVSIDIQGGDSPTLVPGPPVQLFEWSYYARPGPFRYFTASPDGQRFLMADDRGSTEEGSTGREINIVLDWFTELNERVPIP